MHRRNRSIQQPGAGSRQILPQGGTIRLLGCLYEIGASTKAAIPVTGSTAVQVLDNPEFGQVLATSDGLTLYTNTVDSAENLRCIDIACTGFWPPYTVDAEPAAGAEIQGSLGTVIRPDGSKQVTFNQQPLYTFYLDKQQGDAKGNGFSDLGGTWHVVTLGSAPAGNNTETPNASGGYQY